METLLKKGKTQAITVVRQLEQGEEEGGAAAQPKQASDQEELIVIREEINPEHLFMWSAAAEGEIIGDL